LIDVLIDELAASDPVRRVEAAWRLGEICDPSGEIITALKEALRDPELSVRGAAAEALGRIGSLAAEAVIPVVELLDRETDEMGRARCVFALGRAGKNASRAVPVLLDLLRSDNTHAYDTALWALAEIGSYTPEVVEQISRGLDRDVSDQRWTAAKALGLIGKDAAVAVSRLVSALQDVHPLVRELSAWALGEVGSASESALPRLRQLAETDSCAEIRYRAIVSAGLISDGPAEFGIFESEPEIALGKAGRMQQAEQYLTRIENQDRDVQEDCIRAIGELGPPVEKVVPELLPLLANEHLQGSTALAVAKIGVNSKQASAALTSLLPQARPQMLAPLDWAIGLLGPRAVEAIPHLRQQLREYGGSEHRNLEIRYHATWALARVDYLGREVVPDLVASLNDEDSDVRAMAAENLGYIGPAAAQAEAALQAMKKNPHPIVRSRSAWAFKRIRGG
jgi:HEAT repeat protein